MPRLMNTSVNGEWLGAIGPTIVRLSQDKARPVVRKNSICGCGCWGSHHYPPESHAIIQHRAVGEVLHVSVMGPLRRHQPSLRLLTPQRSLRAG
jgi:hypothetical protein